jgi:predicted membrane channel-forming protein YqfA (hemolysin III family)
MWDTTSNITRHCGGVLFPILLAIALFQLFNFYIEQSSLTTTAKLILLWLLVVSALLFILLSRCYHKQHHEGGLYLVL